MSINGTQESGATRVGVPIVDYLTGYNALTGVLLALAARERTGMGQRVEVTLFDTALSLLVPHAANWLCSGNVPGRLGSAHPNIAPYDKFAASDGEIFLGILNDGQFRRFCQKVARERSARRSAFPHQCRPAAACRSPSRRTRAHAGRLQVRRSLPRPDARGRAGGAGEQCGAGVRAAACRPPRHADRERRPPRARHSRKTCANAGRRGTAAAALRRTCPTKYWRKPASIRPPSTA